VTALIVVEALAIVLLALLVVGLLRSHAEILRQLHELGAGRDEPPGPTPVDLRPRTDLRSAPAHDLAGSTPGRDAVALSVAGAEHDTLLAFLSSGCLTCAGFWEALRQERELGLPAGSRLVIVTKGPGEESESAIAELSPPGVAVVMSTQAWLDYEVPGAPYFVHVDGPSGRTVGEGTAVTWEQVMSLAARAADDRMAGGAPAVDRDDDRRREARIDEELMAAGVYPGDPSLYPTAPPASDGEQ
jgi:hypothetical protein